MAVIIQDMDMPAYCMFCPFHFRIDNAHIACSRNPMGDAVEDGDERPKYCPLKEVVVSGNCLVCGKQLDCGRLFVCKECESKFQLT